MGSFKCGAYLGLVVVLILGGEQWKFRGDTEGSEVDYFFGG